jgi:1-aminocyclopropane-1-carboxylate deaminase
LISDIFSQEQWDGKKSLPLHITTVQLKTQFLEIFVIRDDKICFGFGTKLRKLIGLIRELKARKITQVNLQGTLHGNFLAAYTCILFSLGFRVSVNAYSRDQNLKTPNRILIMRHSHDLKIFASEKEMLGEIGQGNDPNHSTIFVLPEYGFHLSALHGLENLWMGVEKTIQMPNTIFLEIGSGLTFLSAIQYFYGSQTVVCGIAVGESKESFLSKLPNMLKRLGIRPDRIANFHIFNPIGGSRFGKKKKGDEGLAKSLYKETNILLEPIYGLRTWEYFLNPKCLPTDLPKPWVYLHQGGQLNHFNPEWIK